MVFVVMLGYIDACIFVVYMSFGEYECVLIYFKLPSLFFEI